MSEKFKTKAETLENLEGRLSFAKVLPQIRFSVQEWQKNGFKLISCAKKAWTQNRLIVRSSSFKEDSTDESKAGFFESVLNVRGEKEVIDAVNKVIDSLGAENASDQIFIQPMVSDVLISGVIFTRDPNNNSPYYVVNYDKISSRTDTVTSGNLENLNTFYQLKDVKKNQDSWKNKLISLACELEEIFDNDALDIEFALDINENLFLLQVRPLVIKKEKNIADKEVFKAVGEIKKRLKGFFNPHPYLHGKRSVLGVMPDWNPAEIIGIRPKPLALSLYKELVTDSIWAYQRNNYGYRNLRSFPLLVSLKGLPYIDARVSFNSFIPKDLSDEIASKLIDYYIEKLRLNPDEHDKVEFEIVFSCYPFDIKNRIEKLKKEADLTEEECEEFKQSLRKLTNNIINNDNGLWKLDILKIENLRKRHIKIMESGLDISDKIYWLLEDCKRYGTLPFAGLARAGFIAVQLLKSMVSTGVITKKNYDSFMNSLETVSSGMGEDKKNLSKDSFLKKYGFLRPGTYDICSPRYDEEPDNYFSWSDLDEKQEIKREDFVLSLESMNGIQALLDEHKLDHDVLSLLNFIKGAIEGREYAKFVFTKSLSDSLNLFTKFGNDYGLKKEDLAFSNIEIIKKLYASSDNPMTLLEESISKGRTDYEKTESINLPPVISMEENAESFEYPANRPNFVTQKKVMADVVPGDIDNAGSLMGKIVVIPSADPGFDWIFTHKIKGLVTKYGGVNSHMAIRAGELGIPGVIGCGDALYSKVEKARSLFVDCGNMKIDIIR